MLGIRLNMEKLPEVPFRKISGAGSSEWFGTFVFCLNYGVLVSGIVYCFIRNQLFSRVSPRFLGVRLTA